MWQGGVRLLLSSLPCLLFADGAAAAISVSSGVVSTTAIVIVSAAVAHPDPDSRSSSQQNILETPPPCLAVVLPHCPLLWLIVLSSGQGPIVVDIVIIYSNFLFPLE